MISQRIIILASVLLLLNSPAHAYLDAGTGSIIAQMLIGGIAGFMVVMKLYWYKIKSFFTRSSNEVPAEDTPQDSE